MVKQRVQYFDGSAWIAAAIWLGACGSPEAAASAPMAPPMAQTPGSSGSAGVSAPGQPGQPSVMAEAGTSGGAAEPAPMGPASATGAGGASGSIGAGGAGTATDPGMPAGMAAYPDLRGSCPALASGFPGDDACIAAPSPEEGFQIHVGPADYEDPAQISVFTLGAGEETSGCWSYHTPNAQDVYYQGYAFSGRPGTHHIFNSMLNVEVSDGGDIHVCIDAGLGNSPERIGSLPAAGKPYTPRTIVAPENAGVGRRIPARVPAEADMHYFNVTDAPILREFWLNIYYIDKKDVTEEGKELRGMGGIGWAVLPIPVGNDEVYKYECPIDTAGRILGMAGHYHAHGRRETVSIRRASGEHERIFDMYDYTNAAQFPFDSVSTNTPLSDDSDGAISGRLDLFAGDVLEWECHIVNDGQVALTYSNDVQNGEMCNLFGTVVGPDINCLIP